MPLPRWVTDGWIYFRLESDDSRARFFWSPDRRTWRVQFVGGEILEPGVPLARPQLFAGAADTAIDYDVVRINDRRSSASHCDGTPCGDSISMSVRALQRTWSRTDGRAWETANAATRPNVWDTPPADAHDLLVPADFAHHVRLTWERLRFYAASRCRAFVRPPICTWSASTSRASRSREKRRRTSSSLSHPLRHRG